jgi:hypothetical protein
MKRFNLKKLNDMEVKEPYHIKISDRFAALEYVDDDDDDDDGGDNNVESMRWNITASATALSSVEIA